MYDKPETGEKRVITNGNVSNSRSCSTTTQHKNGASAEHNGASASGADEALSFQFARIEKRQGVAVVTICDPPANTLTYDMVAQLEEVFFELSLAGDVQAVVLTGEGERFFSGGVNIGMLRTSSAHYNSNFLLYAAEVFEIIDTAPFLVVAAINGHVTGGGLELALVADWRLAIEGTYNLGFPEVRLGVIPGLGGTQRLSRLVGPGTALELITQGEFISVSRAQELGIVARVLSRENFLPAAVSLTRERLHNTPPIARPAAPAIPWQCPRKPLAGYERQGRIGIITLTRDCHDASPLQVIWALNRAILVARLDDALEALLITHSGSELHFGNAPVDEFTWNYSQLVLGRLESFPRLCVFAFSATLDPLATELALACDYRVLSSGKAAREIVFSSTAASRRRAQLLPLRPQIPAGDTYVTGAQAQKQGLVKVLDSTSWPDSILKWMTRFVSPRGASKALGYAKLAIAKGLALPASQGVLLERHLQEQLFRGCDGPEGMRAYLEKRTAVFQGE
jgi:enoyl-CoA hydratase